MSVYRPKEVLTRKVSSFDVIVFLQEDAAHFAVTERIVSFLEFVKSLVSLVDICL
jgi:hypothetical protein